MTTYHLLAISGSLRKESFNSALLRAWQAEAPEGVTVEFADVSVLPLFNQDQEKDFPAVASALKAKIRAADGILISTPEYNRSFSGVLKNAIDWTSRPYGDNAWAQKPVFVMGATGGAIGTAVAQSALRPVLLYLDAHLIGQPEFYLGAAHEKFDEQGILTDATTREHIKKGYDAFLPLIDAFRK